MAARVKKDLTPLNLRCSYGACPAVLLLSDGDLLVVGKKPSPELNKEIEGKVAEDEYAIKISPEYFRKLFK
jgi:hypothetical protein